jgi:thiol-disulfide isomerase/thioredoxin
MAGNVKLHGSLKEFKSDKVELRYTGSSVEIGEYRSITIPVDKEGNFNITIQLEHPTYYAIGQNIVYLSPGDDMEISVGRSLSSSSFKGRGSNANEYLKGYRWNDSQRMGMKFGEKWPFNRIREKADSLAQERLRTLVSLENIDLDFKNMETARIIADRIMVYFNYIYQTDFYRWDDEPDVKAEQKKLYYQTIKNDIEPLLCLIDRSDRYLENASIREILLECFRSGCFKMRISTKLKELTQAIEKSKEMDLGITKANYSSFPEYAHKIEDNEFSEAFYAKLAVRTRLMEGKPAADIDLRNISGKQFKLSDLEGKVLFVDFWATWCLPCIAQKPYLEALSKKYDNIRFVTISIDQDVEKWKNKILKDGQNERIEEYIADPFSVRDEWDLNMIPRFLLIDEDFNIITAFAPRPSEKEQIEALLEKYN